MAIKPTFPKWVPGAEAARITDPGEAKRALGYVYEEKPPFQWFNWGLYNFSQWVLGMQGSFFDIVVGSAAQVTANEATNVIADLTNANVPAESRVLILDGTHTLAANMALSNVDLVIVSESSAAIVAVSTFQILMTGARQMLNLRVTGAGANDIQLSGAGSYFEGTDVDISFVQVSGGAHARTTGTNGGMVPLGGLGITDYVNGVTTYVEDDTGTDSTEFDVDAAIGAAWESVGPTGSGATNIWTALDSIPSAGQWAELHSYNLCTDAAGDSLAQNVWARVTGSSTGLVEKARLSTLFIQTTGPTAISHLILSDKKVPIDSSLRFDLYFEADGSSRTVSLFLNGFGV